MTLVTFTILARLSEEMTKVRTEVSCVPKSTSSEVQHAFTSLTKFYRTSRKKFSLLETTIFLDAELSEAQPLAVT